MNKKSCKKCNIEKYLKDFPPRKSSTDGCRNECRNCTKIAHKKYRDTEAYKIKKKEHWNNWYTKEYYANYRLENRKKINEIHRRYNRKRRKLEKLSSYPEFKEQINNFYKNRPEGYDVDHIIPLFGKNFCGLHVPWNLQYLTKEENRKKRNNLKW